MKHNKEVVVDVLTKFMKLSVDNNNEIIAQKLQGLMPKHLEEELESRVTISANENIKECDEILQKYLNEDMTFEDLVFELNKNALDANIRGQVVAQEFSAEFNDEITEYQLANFDQIEDKLRKLGVPIPEVKINTNGGQA